MTITEHTSRGDCKEFLRQTICQCAVVQSLSHMLLSIIMQILDLCGCLLIYLLMLVYPNYHSEIKEDTLN